MELLIFKLFHKSAAEKDLSFTSVTVNFNYIPYNNENKIKNNRLGVSSYWYLWSKIFKNIDFEQFYFKMVKICKYIIFIINDISG